MRKLRSYVLPFAIVMGLLFHRHFVYLSEVTPYLIFTILLLNNVAVDMKKLRVTMLDVWIMLFQSGGHGFRWTEIDPDCSEWTFSQYEEGLVHPAAERQFANDLEALEWADTCVLVLPCGRSAHTEAGWCKGRGMKTIVYIPKMEEPELMYKLFDGVTDTIEGVRAALCQD